MFWPGAFQGHAVKNMGGALCSVDSHQTALVFERIILSHHVQTNLRNVLIWWFYIDDFRNGGAQKNHFKTIRHCLPSTAPGPEKGNIHIINHCWEYQKIKHLESREIFLHAQFVKRNTIYKISLLTKDFILYRIRITISEMFGPKPPKRSSIESKAENRTSIESVRQFPMRQKG